MAETPNKKAVSEGEIETPPSSPDVKETPSKVEEPKEPEAGEAVAGEEVPEAEGELSERAQKRIRDLSKRVKEGEEAKTEAETLRAELEKARTAHDAEAKAVSPQTAPPGLPWQTPEGGVREITPDEYERDVLSKADYLVRARLEGYEKVRQKEQQFRDDLFELESQYPELREGSDQYDEQMSKRVVTLYKGAGGVFKGPRLKTFVDDVMRLRSGGVEEGKEKASVALTKQSGEAATAPTATGEKPTKPTSTEQLGEMLSSGEITAKEAEEKYPELLHPKEE